MSYLSVTKQYLAIGILVLGALFLFKSGPNCQYNSDDTSNLPIIYGITPTYARLTQKADLTRLSQTLMLVKNFHWIVVEDAEHKTKLVESLLKESGLKYTHLNAVGVVQRNAGLDWLRQHLSMINDKRGFVYFMDDDNTYALKLFEEIRKIRRVGVWPVGIVGGLRVEMPIVKEGKVTGFNAVYAPFRPFPLDMAGFAINATMLLEHPEAKFSPTLNLEGFQESEILKHFVHVNETEPLADNCTKVYVWHTQTLDPTEDEKLKQSPVNDDHIEV